MKIFKKVLKKKLNILISIKFYFLVLNSSSKAFNSSAFCWAFSNGKAFTQMNVATFRESLFDI